MLKNFELHNNNGKNYLKMPKKIVHEIITEFFFFPYFLLDLTETFQESV